MRYGLIIGQKSERFVSRTLFGTHDVIDLTEIVVLIACRFTLAHTLIADAASDFVSAIYPANEDGAMFAVVKRGVDKVEPIPGAYHAAWCIWTAFFRTKNDASLLARYTGTPIDCIDVVPAAAAYDNATMHHRICRTKNTF